MRVYSLVKSIVFAGLIAFPLLLLLGWIFAGDNSELGAETAAALPFAVLVIGVPAIFLSSIVIIPSYVLLYVLGAARWAPMILGLLSLMALALFVAEKPQGAEPLIAAFTVFCVLIWAIFSYFFFRSER